MRACSIDGCDAKHYCRGLCRPHYRKTRPTTAFLAQRTERTCGHCGEQFSAKAKDAARNKNWYCSQRCYHGWRREACKRREAGPGKGLTVEEAERRRRAGKSAARAVRRARELDAAERIDPQEIFERDGWRCGICRRKVNRRLNYPNPRSASLDHIVALAAGGRHVRSNVQCSHLECNRRKSHTGAGQLLLIG